ncbi:hypothetical protein ACOTWR_06500 [Aliarcobacter butzleri]|uniref:hypothetical protein n=1 Tax=Aliarcobacter butzleri TaxID=28197 RepID=UPI0021B406EF|nr:hypothetical protein [Aliarcobacter butzleri]MCT7564140.1 hypothetical protein [Aliarcobacter butzleri]MCT7578700.1 hypothetical protein [Aliarcobacter butzleri]MCT7647646.1 hypothetical protein [Aliarcobacter butzleri]
MEININNIQINIINFNEINYNKIIKAQDIIVDKYKILKRNARQGLLNKNDIGIAINDIAINLKYLFDIDFKSYSIYNSDINNRENDLKKFIDFALEVLEEIKIYFDKGIVLEVTFNEFKEDVLNMINISSGKYNGNLKSLIENILIYEILRKNNYHEKVYFSNNEFRVYPGYHSNDDYFLNLGVTDKILEKYHKVNYEKILKMSHNTNQESPLLYKLYLESIKKFRNILNKESIFVEVINEYKLLSHNGTK